VFGYTPSPAGEFPDEFPIAPYSIGEFNGSVFNNTLAGGRILSSYGGTNNSSASARSNAAGSYRVGKGDFSKSKIGKLRFKQRKEGFDAIAPSWDRFFGCLGVRAPSPPAKLKTKKKK